ncbi:MAG: hypothetical protein RMJ87_03305 [Cytophagales bacterium]|nr:hypothetical protein [Bernardetiaceae bacterium]MDW8204035.1 hypothetical protein [Cytophagales bacterium]
MKKWIVAVCGLCLLGCNPDKKTKVSTEEVHFTTSASSVLFFKNVRQIYYERQENNAAKAIIYRMRSRVHNNSIPLLYPAIVYLWAQDEAAVILERNEFLADTDTLRFIWQDTVQQTSGEYVFPNGDRRTHYRLAAQLYHSIQEEHRLWLQTDSGRIPFFVSEKEREPFRKTMVDYFRLVNVLR